MDKAFKNFFVFHLYLSVCTYISHIPIPLDILYPKQFRHRFSILLEFLRQSLYARKHRIPFDYYI